MAELSRPICPFWATVYGRNLSGFGDKTGFAFFFRFAGELSVSFFVFLFFNMPLYAGVQFARLIFLILTLHLLRETIQFYINRYSNRVLILSLYSYYYEQN